MSAGADLRPKEDSSPLLRRRLRFDSFFLLTWAAAAAGVGVLAWIIVSMVAPAMPAIAKSGIGFFVNSKWDNRAGFEQFGALSMLLGTVESSLIALLVALPLGVMIALFLSENFLPFSVRQSIRFVVELLAAIPSVVFGLWGYVTIIPLVHAFGPPISSVFGFIPLFKGSGGGPSMMSASLVLALMVLPTITAISRGVLIAVPVSLREGSYALGSTRWETIFSVLIPTAAPGIIAATILAFGRAMGETMAVAMLIGNNTNLQVSLFQSGSTLAGNIANSWGAATDLERSALLYSALVLVLLTLLVNVAGEFILHWSQKKTAGIR